MINYCGMCGFSLDKAALRARRCPNCGAPIDRTSDVLGLGGADVADIQTRPDAAASTNANAPAQSTLYATAAAFEVGRSADTLPQRQEPRLQEDASRNRERGLGKRQRSRRVSSIWQFAFLA